MELGRILLAISRSCLLIAAIVGRLGSRYRGYGHEYGGRPGVAARLRPQIIPTGIEIGIVAGLLLAGGYLEFYMIELAQEQGLTVPGLDV